MILADLGSVIAVLGSVVLIAGLIWAARNGSGDREAEEAARRFDDRGLYGNHSETDPAEVLAWAGETFGDALAVACSMANTVVPEMAAPHAPGVDVLFLDTGYHFA